VLVLGLFRGAARRPPWERREEEAGKPEP